jgi:hypothetical protein
VFAKRYGWSIEYILGLTRRQVRLLMVSAGDNERLPDDSSQDGEDLSQAPKEMEVQQKHIDKIRRGVGIAHKSHVVDRMIGKKLDIEYKKPNSPVRGKQSDESSKDGMKELLNMARSGQGIKMGNKLNTKLQKKRNG